MSGAEIVYRQTHPNVVQLRHDRLIDNRQGVTLCQLNHQLRMRISGPPYLLQIFHNGAIVKMAGGDVNRNMERAALRQLRQGLYGPGNHKAGQGSDQVLPFRQWDKDIRRNPSLARIMPAQQKLNTFTLFAAGIDQRLTVNHKFTGGDPVADLPAEAHTIGRGQPDNIANQQAQHHCQRQLGRQRI